MPRLKLFERGNIKRAERNILAEKLKHNPEIKNPYALATSMIKRGFKVRDKEAIKKEFKEQVKIKKELEKKKTRGIANPENIQITPKFCSEITLIIGKRGTGKSWTAGIIAEEMHSLNIQFIFIDTQNANKGLGELEGVKTTNTKTEPKKLALELLTTGQSVLISNISSLEDLQKWTADFLNAYMSKEVRGIRTIFIDEIHLLCPNHKITESSSPIRRLITTKRNEGIGVVMITQRPALVDTTIINQTDNLFIHKVSGLRDLEVLKEILSYETTNNKELINILVETKNFKEGKCILISDSVKGD